MQYTVKWVPQGGDNSALPRIYVINTSPAWRDISAIEYHRDFIPTVIVHYLSDVPWSNYTIKHLN